MKLVQNVDPSLCTPTGPPFEPHLDPFWTPIWIPFWTSIWTPYFFFIWTPFTHTTLGLFRFSHDSLLETFRRFRFGARGPSTDPVLSSHSVLIKFAFDEGQSVTLFKQKAKLIYSTTARFVAREV